MGKVVFRKIGGRVVPIFSHEQQSALVPAKAASKMKQIQELRHVRRSHATPTSGIGKIIHERQHHFITHEGKSLGSHLSLLARKMKGKNGTKR